MEKQIVVLGVGNILLHDEGIGVRVLETLQAEYTFGNNVQLVDGGTLGLRLLEVVSAADHLIIIDAVCNGSAPGTLYRLPVDSLNRRVLSKQSLHQTGMLETLACAELLGNRPPAVIIGVEPADISPFGLGLTDVVAARLPDLVAAALAEISAAGGAYERLDDRGISP
jgi:hydrogenase maturation protease